MRLYCRRAKISTDSPVSSLSSTFSCLLPERLYCQRAKISTDSPVLSLSSTFSCLLPVRLYCQRAKISTDSPVSSLSSTFSCLLPARLYCRRAKRFTNSPVLFSSQHSPVYYLRDSIVREPKYLLIALSYSVNILLSITCETLLSESQNIY